MNFTPLERDILRWVVQTSKEDALVKQVLDARPRKRKFTGVGSFTDLRVRSNSPKVTKRVYFAGTMPFIDSPQLEHGADCILFSENGLLSTLEIVATVGRFPQIVQEWKLLDRSVKAKSVNSQL